jgi:pimeloyl-ACP methyl ester carboxylesterase
MNRRRRALSPYLLCALLAIAAPALAASDDVSAPDQFFDSDGVKIHYRTWGQGDPIVLVHGFTASIDSNWLQPGIVGALAKEFKVIALDNRGHGQSDKPRDPAAYGEKMAGDVVRLLDHLAIEKAHLVGYSMGGFITLKLVTMHPERFLSATLGGAGWRPPGEDSGVTGLAESLESGNGIAPLMEALRPAGQPKPSAEQIKMVNDMLMATNDPLALAAAIRGMAGLQVPEGAALAIEVPMLAVVGELDPLRAGVDKLHALLPGLEVVVLPGKDHMTAIADPALAEAVRGFVVKLCQCA